jgi:uncharacterized protein YndB with AHSA1/START domain
MPTEFFRLTSLFAASPAQVFAAWLDSKAHTAMTGAAATIDPHVGGAFMAADGYIRGRTLELDPGRRIVQAWRTSEFSNEHADSRLELHLRSIDGGTELTLVHEDIPEGQGAGYHQGWHDHYFAPMAKYFGAGKASGGTANKKPKAKAKPAKKKTAPKKSAATKPARKKPKAAAKLVKKKAVKKKISAKTVGKKKPSAASRRPKKAKARSR